MASAKRALRESPYTVESLRTEAEATRRLLTDRARKARILAKQQQEQQQQEGEEEEELDVDEALEVEGGFDPTPELKSRFGDKSSSLRFVTAEEDARKRKEELASVFAARNKAAAEEDEEEERSSTSPAAAGEASENLPPQSDSAAAGDAGEEQGIIKGQMKAFGAILEKTLAQAMLGRVPPSGSVAAGGAAAGAGVGAIAGGKAGLLSPTRQQQQQPSETKAPAVLTPPFKPKSKFFRSIRSPGAGSQVDGDGSGSAGGTGRPLVPPPPAPMMGLLAQIRAAKDGSRGGSGIDGEKGAENPILGESKDSGIAPPALPQPSAPSLPPRSLFAAAGPSAAASQGPPPDFFAQLRAKAVEKQALRRAAEGETDN